MVGVESLPTRKNLGTKRRSKHYYDWTYRENFYFLLEFTPDEVLEWLDRNKDERPVFDLNKFDGASFDVKNGIVVWVRSRKSSEKFYPHLAHECIHAAAACLDRRHIEVSYKNDEVLCYLVQCLVGKALE